MFKVVFYTFLLGFTIVSCSRSRSSSEANIICACFDHIHDESVRTDDVADLQEKVNACSKMLEIKLSSFGDNQEKRSAFMESFRACQEN